MIKYDIKSVFYSAVYKYVKMNVYLQIPGVFLDGL